jgi:hypothetical protein
MLHIRKKVELDSDDGDSHNSNLEIQKEDSLVSFLDEREAGDINSLEPSYALGYSQKKSLSLIRMILLRLGLAKTKI